MDANEKWTWSIFGLLIGITVALFIFGFLTNMNAIRKIHRDYTAGFLFQKECDDEYTEKESARKYSYDAIINNQLDLDWGARYNIYLLLWVPLSIALLLVIYLRYVSVSSPTNPSITTSFYGYFYVASAITILLGTLLYKVGFDDSSKQKLFSYLRKKDCYVEDESATPQRLHATQFGLFILLMIVIATFIMVQRILQRWSSPSQPPSVLQLGGLSKVFFEKTLGYNYVIYGTIVLWVFVMIWISKTTTLFDSIHKEIICYYPEKITTYKFRLAEYIQQNPKQYEPIKKIIQQNYFRIHQSYPDVNISNVDDFVYYLMHMKGRELETIEDKEEESSELIELKNFMRNLRTDAKYDTILRGFLQWCTRYFILQFVVILYIAFHLLYTKYTGPVSYSMIISIVISAFILSWYSWFDTVLVV